MFLLFVNLEYPKYVQNKISLFGPPQHRWWLFMMKDLSSLCYMMLVTIFPPIFFEMNVTSLVNSPWHYKILPTFSETSCPENANFSYVLSTFPTASSASPKYRQSNQYFVLNASNGVFSICNATILTHSTFWADTAIKIKMRQLFPKIPAKSISNIHVHRMSSNVIAETSANFAVSLTSLF